MNMEIQSAQLDAFLERMNRATAWSDLERVAEQSLSGDGAMCDTFSPSVVVRIYLMQRWFGLSDAAMAEAMHDVPSMRRFAGVGTSAAALPSEAAIQNFRELFEGQRMPA